MVQRFVTTTSLAMVLTRIKSLRKDLRKCRGDENDSGAGSIVEIRGSG